MLSRYVKKHYEASFNKMDVVIANSENVRNRIRKYLGSDSIVIHPPVEIESFNWIGQGDYYLSTSRLEPYKRAEMIAV